MSLNINSINIVAVPLAPDRNRTVETIVEEEFCLTRELLFGPEGSANIIVTSPSLGSSGYPFFSSSSRIPEATKARPQRKQPVTILCSGVVRRPNFPGRDDGSA